MSTFFGLVKEIPGISVDRFDEENLSSSVFFLSHCHSDHMKGLTDSFFSELQQSNKFIYCSPISRVILESTFRYTSSCIKEIDIDTPTIVEYKAQNNGSSIISVTCVPAGHCPGSVMFLFERNLVSVLYTGDFRINPSDFTKLRSLHYYEKSTLLPRTFDKIYLDTTFLCPDFSYLPTRQESMIKICEAIQGWLIRGPRNVVILDCSALYGSEYLFMEISKCFKQKIHVKDKVYQSYCRIPELSCYVTNDPKDTFIHACTNKSTHSGLKCRDDIDESHVLTIIPSVLKWRGNDTTKVAEWDRSRERTFNVCYSTHASFDELKEFIQYFNTLEIFPCVAPKEQEDEVNRVLKEISKRSEEKSPVETERYQLELPICRVMNKVPFKSAYFSDDDDSL